MESTPAIVAETLSLTPPPLEVTGHYRMQANTNVVHLADFADQLRPHGAAVPTITPRTPGHNGAAALDGSKRPNGGLNLADLACQLRAHGTVVPAMIPTTPGHNGAVALEGSKCKPGGLDLADLAG